MNSSLIDVIPLAGDEVVCRDSAERLNEEVYRSIPALMHFANAAMQLSNKLSLDARNALFFDAAGDPELRALKVENALVKRHDMESVQPDMEWLRGMSPATRKDFETADNDVWLSPAGPGQ